MANEIKWNNKVKLILADVDETIADLYLPAEPEMIKELISLLQESKSIFFITGQSIKSLQWRIVDKIPKDLRRRILIGHCSGAEVWGYDVNGNLRDKPFYSVYENALSDEQKKKWREIVKQLIEEFKLECYDTMPINEFNKKARNSPRAVMLEDRGPQITLEVVNGYNLTPDFRLPIVEKAQQLLKSAQLPITPRIAGVFAIDMAVRGVNKTTAVKRVLNDENTLATLGLSKIELEDPESMEIWGDKFSTLRGGTDRHISEALPKTVRSVDFREENPEEFLPGYNIVVWNGKQHLHHGLLEYLQFRHNRISKVLTSSTSLDIAS